MDTWPAAPSQACSGQAVPHYQGGRAPPTPGARKPESKSGLSGKGWGSITRHVPRQVTTSKPQFPQGLSFRAGPPAGWGSLSCSPASSPAEQQSPRPNSAHPTKAAGQQGAERRRRRSLHTAGSCRAGCPSRGHRSLEPATSLIGKSYGAAWAGQELACQALAAPFHHWASQSPTMCWALWQALGQRVGSRPQF